MYIMHLFSSNMCTKHTRPAENPLYVNFVYVNITASQST